MIVRKENGLDLSTNREVLESRDYRVGLYAPGAVTPLANNFTDTYRAMMNGKNGIGILPENLHVKRGNGKRPRYVTLGGQLNNFSFENGFKKYNLPEDSIARRLVDNVEPAPQAALYAIRTVEESLRGANLLGESGQIYGHGIINPEDVNVIVGSTHSTICETVEFERRRQKGETGDISDLLKVNADRIAALTSMFFNIRGRQGSANVGCSTGLSMMGDALRYIRHEAMWGGRRKVVVVSAAEAPFVNDSVLQTYVNAGILTLLNDPRNSMHSFTKNAKKGTILTEGSSSVVLMPMSLGDDLGLEPLAEIINVSDSSDGANGDSTTPNGDIQQALVKSMYDNFFEGDPETVVLVHGSGTKENDKIESRSYVGGIGENRQNVSYVASKRALGHPFSYGGIFDAAFAAMMIDQRIILGNYNLENSALIDEASGLNFQNSPQRNVEVLMALVNAIGIGGSDSLLVLRSPDEKLFS